MFRHLVYPACRLVMKPEKALDSDQKLEWSYHHGPITGSGIIGGFGVMEETYVRDEVLVTYENRPEFDINPEAGTVGNGTWWAVGILQTGLPGPHRA